MEVPEKGLPRDVILRLLEAYGQYDMSTKDGRVWAYVYSAGKDVDDLATEAYVRYLSHNALDPTVYPSILQFENELVAMAKSHVGGDDEVTGSVTTGGTESILLAVKTARDHMKATRGIERPQMVLATTAHAAFHKAARYFEVEPVTVDVDPETYRAVPEAMEAAITDRTILLVGSAPSYAHGVIDPIGTLAGIARARGLLCHVDACVGGFILHYFRRLGATVPPYGFDVPGVTSLSMDLHKYGFAQKNASVVLYRDRDLRHHQWFACSGWTGYTVINPTVMSTKSGGPIASAWATMYYLGQEGYLRIAEATLAASRELLAGLDAIPDLQVMGRPDANLMSVCSDTVDVFQVADEMRARGWYVQPQLGFGRHRKNLHFSVGPHNAMNVAATLADLRDAVAAAKRLPASTLAAEARADYQDLTPADVTPEVYREMIDRAGIREDALPDRMAEINAVLDSIPAAAADQLLIRYLNRINHLDPRTGAEFAARNRQLAGPAGKVWAAIDRVPVKRIREPLLKALETVGGWLG